MSFVSFLNAPRCSRLRAPRLDDMSPRPRHPWCPLDKKGRPRFILNHEGRQNTIRPRWYTAISVTTPTRVSFSMHAAATRRMAPHAAITHAEADDMIARRTKAPHPSLWVHASSARPFGGLNSQPDFVNRPTLSSTLGKRTLMCGLLTTA
jgi:hypothetical protein